MECVTFWNLKDAGFFTLSSETKVNFSTVIIVFDHLCEDSANKVDWSDGDLEGRAEELTSRKCSDVVHRHDEEKEILSLTNGLHGTTIQRLSDSLTLHTSPHTVTPRLQWHSGYNDSFESSQLSINISQMMRLEWHLLTLTHFSCPMSVTVRGEVCIGNWHGYQNNLLSHQPMSCGILFLLIWESSKL